MQRLLPPKTDEIAPTKNIEKISSIDRNIPYHRSSRVKIGSPDGPVERKYFYPRRPMRFLKCRISTKYATFWKIHRSSRVKICSPDGPRENAAIFTLEDRWDSHSHRSSRVKIFSPDIPRENAAIFTLEDRWDSHSHRSSRVKIFSPDRPRENAAIFTLRG
jgi:hypothetical protein